MSAPVDIGALNRRLILQALSEVPDGMGGVMRDYDAVATLWGGVTPLAGRSDVAADSYGASQRFRIVIRFRSDLTIRHRLIDGAHIYRIVAVREFSRRRFLEIDAEERDN